MRDPVGALWKAVESGNPVMIVYYHDLGRRDALVSEVESLIEEGIVCVRTDDVQRAFSDLNSVLLLTPQEENLAVEVLEARLETLLSRTQPLVLFLFAAGRGLESLRRSPNLASWVRGSDIDPDQLAEVDLAMERQKFDKETGQTPESWLVGYRAGGKPEEDVRFVYDALLLEQK